MFLILYTRTIGNLIDLVQNTQELLLKHQYNNLVKLEKRYKISLDSSL